MLFARGRCGLVSSIALPAFSLGTGTLISEMSLSKKRKVDTECRIFQEKWTSSYMFTEVNGKPVCLVCMRQVSVLKEYNIRRHYETQHGEKYNSLHGELRKQKVNEMLVGLRKQQSVFTQSREVSDAAVKASYVIASQVALASKPYSEGEFVKNCMLKAAEIVCPEKRQAFANISLTRNTVADRISEQSADLKQTETQSGVISGIFCCN